MRESLTKTIRNERQMVMTNVTEGRGPSVRCVILLTLGARIPGTSDYMLRILRALVKCTWILISNNNLGTFEMYPQHLSNMELLRKFW